MTRHRFRAADPPQGRFVLNGRGVEAARRSRRSIAVSAVLVGASWSRYFGNAVDAARGRIATRQSNMPRCNGLAAGLAFHADRAGENSAASSRRRNHDIHITVTKRN